MKTELVIYFDVPTRGGARRAQVTLDVSDAQQLRLLDAHSEPAMRNVFQAIVQATVDTIRAEEVSGG